MTGLSSHIIHTHRDKQRERANTGADEADSEKWDLGMVVPRREGKVKRQPGGRQRRINE